MSEEQWVRSGLTKAEIAFLRFSLSENYKNGIAKASNTFMIGYNLGYNAALAENDLAPVAKEGLSESFDEWYNMQQLATKLKGRKDRYIAAKRSGAPLPHPEDPKVEDS